MNKSFNNITVGFLIVVLLAYSFKTVTVVASFALHQDEIAKNLCEQKDVLEQTCNGKCQLVKALKSHVEKKQAPLEQTQKRYFSHNYLQPKNNIQLHQFSLLKIKSDFYINKEPIIIMNYDILIPPPKVS